MTSFGCRVFPRHTKSNETGGVICCLGLTPGSNLCILIVVCYILDICNTQFILPKSFNSHMIRDSKHAPMTKKHLLLGVFWRGVGLELFHITLLFTGDHYISLVANDWAIFAPNLNHSFDYIYAVIKIRKDHESGILIRLYIGQFPGGVRPRYTSIVGT